MWFQVHGIDAAEKVVIRKQLRRSQVLAFFKVLPPCLIGMEACAWSPPRPALRPAAFVEPCLPTLAKAPPAGPTWVLSRRGLVGAIIHTRNFI